MPLRADPKLISKDDLRVIFSEIEVVVGYTRMMLAQIQDRLAKWHINQLVGPCFHLYVRSALLLQSTTNNIDCLFEDL